MDNRAAYLSDPFGRVDPDHEKVIPDYLLREAQQDDPTEAEFRLKTEVATKGRHFRQQFLEKTTVVNRQALPLWEPEKAADWLLKQSKQDGKFSRTLAAEILEAAGCLDEKRTEVLHLVGQQLEDAPSAPISNGSPTQDFQKENTPSRLSDVELDKEEAKLRKRRRVGSYGVVLTEDACQLYKQGELLSEIRTADCGGFGVLASEVDGLRDDADADRLFGLESDSEAHSVGWFKSSSESRACCAKNAAHKFCPECGQKLGAGTLFENPIYQRLDDQKGQSGEFNPAHVDQSPESPEPADDLGPISVTPGAPALSPSIPTIDDARPRR